MSNEIFFFSHIPKAGGQTLLQAFYKTFGKESCMRMWDPRAGGDVDPASFRHVPVHVIREYKAIVGHLSVNQMMANTAANEMFEAGKLEILASVRDPVERVLSHYNFSKHHKASNKHEFAVEATPEEFLLSAPKNFQYNFLIPRHKSGVGEIFKIMKVFPVEQSRELVTRLLRDRTGVDPGRLEIKNRTKYWSKGEETTKVDDISQEVIDHLIESNRLDYALYDQAKIICQDSL